MAKAESKNINIEVSYETWKRLKIVSIEKDITMQDVVREVLDKFVSKKGKQEIDTQE